MRVFEIEEKIKNPIFTFSKRANMYYVYRHYYFNEKAKEVTFYVGKGQGTRAWSENNRSDTWKEKVSMINGDYYIDIVESFSNEKDALKFEKELISYYTVNEFGCECNKISKSEMSDIFLESINASAIETMLDSNISLDDILKTFTGMYQDLLGRNLIEIMAQFMKFLKSNNSKYEIVFDNKANLKDINSYQYKLYNTNDYLCLFPLFQVEKNLPSVSAFLIS